MRANDWTDELAALLPDHAILRDPADLAAYCRDASVIAGVMPKAALQPRDAATVARVLAHANARAIPVYAYGAGSMYAGAAPAAEPGLMLDMACMDRIIEIDESRGIVVVEPGVTFGRLQKVLGERGLSVGVVPMTGASGTVGGTVSSHGLGTGSPRFQSLGDEVAGLEVVLADGTLVRTGSGASQAAGFFQRYCIGPDLTGLFLGANAGFGIITKVALWLHPAPARQETLCLGFPDTRAAADFLIAQQNRELVRNVWYGAAYDGGAIRARVAAARPGIAPDTLPGACVALDMRGEPEELDRDIALLVALAGAHGGARFDLFDEIFFAILRKDRPYWYSFAGYFGPSRSVLMMHSLPTAGMPGFLEAIGGFRARHPQFTWGGGIILCRRGLHGAVIAFYDEQTQWAEMQQVLGGIRAEMVAMGCVPYKGGRLWSDMGDAWPAYRDVLGRIRAALDPAGIMGRGSFGLDAPPG